MPRGTGDIIKLTGLGKDKVRSQVRTDYSEPVFLTSGCHRSRSWLSLGSGSTTGEADGKADKVG